MDNTKTIKVKPIILERQNKNAYVCMYTYIDVLIIITNDYILLNRATYIIYNKY